MNQHNVQTGYFLALLGTAFLGMVLMFAPYLSSLLLAATLAIVFEPIHRRMAKLLGGWESIAAILTTLLVLAVVLIPLFLLGAKILEETLNLATNNGTDSITSVGSTLEKLNVYLQRVAPSFAIDTRILISKVATAITDNISSIFSSAIKTTINLFLTVVAFFYLLRDGKKFRQAYINISPLTNQQDEEVLGHLTATVSSVVKGSLFTAAVQGVFAGLGYAIFGIPNPFLFGSATAIAALIPGIGTALMVTPIVIITYASGQTSSAIGLLIWSAILVGLVDNFLGPMVMNRGIRIHPMIVLLAVIGGITLFGPMGLLIGPLIASLFFTLVHIYATFMRDPIK